VVGGCCASVALKIHITEECYGRLERGGGTHGYVMSMRGEVDIKVVLSMLSSVMWTNNWALSNPTPTHSPIGLLLIVPMNGQWFLLLLYIVFCACVCVSDWLIEWLMYCRLRSHRRNYIEARGGGCLLLISWSCQSFTEIETVSAILSVRVYIAIFSKSMTLRQ